MAHTCLHMNLLDVTHVPAYSHGKMERSSSSRSGGAAAANSGDGLEPPQAAATGNSFSSTSSLTHHALCSCKWKDLTTQRIKYSKVLHFYNYSAVIGDRVPTSALASGLRAHEGAQRAYLRTPVSQVKCEGN